MRCYHGKEENALHLAKPPITALHSQPDVDGEGQLSDRAPYPESLPYDSLNRLRSVIPEDLRKPNLGKALFSIASGLAFMVLWALASFWALAESAWYAWPATWWIGGIVFTSWFVLAHDCGHFSLLKSRRVMSMLGHIFSAPGLYPFWAWKYAHDAHHKDTNRLRGGGNDIYHDNAWIPLTPALWKRVNKNQPKIAAIYKISRWVPLVGSCFHLSLYHFNPRMFHEGEHRNNVKKSIVFLVTVFLVGAAFMSAGTHAVTGSWGLAVFAPFHLWVIPALLLHFWMATYTFLHHTTKDSKFYDGTHWTPYKGQFKSTINVYMPRWISFLHFNIDIHVPHHVLQTIPSYYLRSANEAIQNSEYGKELREKKFSVQYYWETIKECQLWDPSKEQYLSFKDVSLR